MSNGKRFTLEEAVALTYDDETVYHYPLTQREAFMLLGQIDFIGWQTRWKDRSFTQDYLNEKVASIADGLMNPMSTEIDCADIENCLETSTIINNIEGDVVTIQGSVSAVEGDITTINKQITIINQSAQYNIYPPAPDPETEPDPYCGTSWYIAEYLNAYIQDVITDALTLTWQEVAIGLLGIGGFDASLAKLLWDYIIASANPTLDDECIAGIEEIAELFFCNNLLVADVITAINASGTLTTGAKQAYTKAIESLTVSKFSELIYLGSLDESRDCSSFCPDCIGPVVRYPSTGWLGFSPLSSEITLFGGAFSVENYFSRDYIDMATLNSGFVLDHGNHCIKSINFKAFRFGTVPTISVYLDDVLLATVDVNIAAGNLQTFTLDIGGIRGDEIKLQTTATGGSLRVTEMFIELND